MVPSSFITSTITDAEREAGQPRQVATGLGVTGAGQHATFLGAQREDVAGLHQIFSAGIRRHGSRDRAGSVSGGNAGGDTDGCFNRYGECGAEHAAIARHHLLQAQALAVIVGQGQADQPACLACHETDRFGCATVGGQQQVAFVFAVFVIDQQDHFAEAIIFDDFFDAVEGHAGLSGFDGNSIGIP
jgi:hypothetical protein